MKVKEDGDTLWGFWYSVALAQGKKGRYRGFSYVRVGSLPDAGNRREPDLQVWMCLLVRAACKMTFSHLQGSKTRRDWFYKCFYGKKIQAYVVSCKILRVGRV